MVMLAHLDANRWLPAITVAESDGLLAFTVILEGPLPVREPYFNDPLRRSVRVFWSNLDLPVITHLAQYFARLPRR